MSNNEKINPSEILGFYFLVYQSYPGKYIKAWLDGDENFTIYYPEDIIDMCNKANVDSKVIHNLLESFSETSVFMWNVECNQVSRLSVRYEPSNIGEEINKIKNNEVKPLAETTQVGWGSFLDTSDGKISLKF